MKISAQEWIAKGKQMFLEEFPDSYEILESVKVEFASEEDWIHRRSEIAQLCGEASSKRERVQSALENDDLESIQGEFTWGEFGQAVILKTELLAHPSLLMEAFLHELTHAYCHWLDAKDRKLTMDCQLGQCENQNVQLGYYVWKEFVAQTISLKICKKNRIMPYTYTAADLSEYLQKIVSTDMAAGDIGMFFAEFFTNQKGKSQNGMLLALIDCMNEQGDAIKDEIGAICDLLWPKFRKISLKRINVAFLEELGEYVSGLQEEVTAEVVEGYQNLTKEELENLCLQIVS